MAEVAENQTELLFCMKCEKETVTQPVQKICSVCGLSRRWNAFLSWINIPFDQLERWLKGLRNVVLALIALLLAFAGFKQFQPDKPETREIAGVKGCINAQKQKGQCVQIQFRNDGKAADRLVNLQLSVLLSNENNERIIDDYVPAYTDLIEENSTIDPNDTTTITLEKRRFGNYFVEPHNVDVDGVDCHFYITAETKGTPSITGNGPCW